MFDLLQLQSVIQQGGIIAYPTEGVYGLGCDPFNEMAVQRLLQLKQRPISKGLIVIASEWLQVNTLVADSSLVQKTEIQHSWPGPITWVFPASELAPAWITGENPGIALRITDHPVAKALCQSLQLPLVSTSANISNAAPMRSVEQVQQQFGDSVDLIIPGALGDLIQPTDMFDAVSLRRLR